MATFHLYSVLIVATGWMIFSLGEYAAAIYAKKWLLVICSSCSRFRGSRDFTASRNYQENRVAFSSRIPYFCIKKPKPKTLILKNTSSYVQKISHPRTHQYNSARPLVLRIIKNMLENATLHTTDKWEIQIPDGWVVATGATHPATGTLEFALKSDVKYGFTNNLIIISDSLTNIMTSARYSELNNIQSSKNYTSNTANSIQKVSLFLIVMRRSSMCSPLDTIQRVRHSSSSDSESLWVDRLSSPLCSRSRS